MLLTLLAFMLSDEPNEKEKEYEYSIDCVDMGIELEEGEKLNETND